MSPLDPPLRVVGIGGSAGALDSYERFFLGLPPSTGMAFVVLPHLDPNHQGLMPDILSRCTSMPVVQITGSQPLRANCVHVIPPGHSLSVASGTLHLGDLALAGRHVIDYFFEALAADQRGRAVGIVMSGLGSDGTQGIRAIKRLGGRVLIEDPQTAQSPAMPSSAASTGLADAVLPALELAARLMSLTEVPHLLNEKELSQGGSESGTPLQTILRLIRSRSGHDFTRYKHATLVRRIDRRMKGQGIQDVAGYLRLLEESPEEIEALFQDFTINVTSFFRDAEAFEVLKVQLRSYLQDHKQVQDTLRVWVAACSTGEEAYSVAIVLYELISELAGDHTLKVQIFATDIDPVVVKTARQGRYSRDIAYVVSPERLQRFFQLEGDQYRVRAEIRDSVVFATHSTFADPPFTRLDLVSCRNLLIYVGAELQRQIVGLFRYALRPSGLLFLGTSESVGTDQDAFTALDRRWKIYRRREGTAGLPPLGTTFLARTGETPPSGWRAPERGQVRITPTIPADLSPRLQDALLAEYAPPAVVVNGQGDVLFVHGRTGRYLEFPPGQVQNNVFEMVPVSLRLALQSAVREAHRERRRVTYRGLVAARQSESQTDHAQMLDLSVRPLQSSSAEPLLITFQERHRGVTQPEDASDAGHRLALELELRHGREVLHAMVEDSARSVEELQTSSEELQSTNEELMTSKEELQSLNEELSTVNAEHQVIIQDQARANDDLNNLLDTAGTGILFLGNDLTIRRFTFPIGRLVRLTPADAGRPLSDFNILLRHNQLLTDIHRVLETLEPHEAQVQTHDGEWFLLRINPYRTTDNHIDGVVVALTSIALVKALEWQLVEALNLTEAALDAPHDPLLLLDQHLRAVTASQALLTLLETTGPLLQGERLLNTGDFALNLPELRRRLLAVIETGEPVSTRVPGAQHARELKIEAERVVSRDGRRELFLLQLNAADDAEQQAQDADPAETS
ncbi:CheR family methyltransferase [Deinococcus alpinitundrae]|uniref:CheR family methyltransferase n=1 Tax=Deinococcus alpinitundrae TaxID=468913 RepID=UPI00137A7BC8|nr:CheR family methyltransferase [Deinococcus alpinitundrae]